MPAAPSTNNLFSATGMQQPYANISPAPTGGMSIAPKIGATPASIFSPTTAYGMGGRSVVPTPPPTGPNIGNIFSGIGKFFGFNPGIGNYNQTTMTTPQNVIQQGQNSAPFSLSGLPGAIGKGLQIAAGSATPAVPNLHLAMDGSVVHPQTGGVIGKVNSAPRVGVSSPSALAKAGITGKTNADIGGGNNQQNQGGNNNGNNAGNGGSTNQYANYAAKGWSVINGLPFNAQGQQVDPNTGLPINTGTGGGSNTGTGNTGTNTGGSSDTGTGGSNTGTGGTGGGTSGSGSTDQTTTPPPTTPTAPTNPYNSPEYKSAVDAYTQAGQMTPQEQQIQAEEGNLQSSLGLTTADMASHPTDLPFLTGEQANVTARTNAQLQGLESEASRLQAQRLAAQSVAQQNITNLQTKYNSPYSAPQILNPGQTLTSPTGQNIAGGAPQQGDWAFGINGVTGQPYSYNNKTGEYRDMSGNPTTAPSSGTNFGNVGTQSNAPPTGQALTQAVQSITNPIVKGAINTDSQGGYYLNSDKITNDAAKTAATQTAMQLGIPVLNTAQTGALKSIDDTLGLMPTLQKLVNDNLKGGIIGRGMDIVNNALNNWFQTNPDLTQLNNYGLQAISVIRSLGGQGSGVRVTNSELATANSVQPDANDNLETAQRKITTLTQVMNEIRQNLYSDNIPGGASQTGGTQGTQGGTNTDTYSSI